MLLHTPPQNIREILLVLSPSPHPRIKEVLERFPSGSLLFQNDHLKISVWRSFISTLEAITVQPRRGRPHVVFTYQVEKEIFQTSFALPQGGLVILVDHLGRSITVRSLSSLQFLDPLAEGNLVVNLTRCHLIHPTPPVFVGTWRTDSLQVFLSAIQRGGEESRVTFSYLSPVDMFSDELDPERVGRVIFVLDHWHSGIPDLQEKFPPVHTVIKANARYFLETFRIPPPKSNTQMVILAHGSEKFRTDHGSSIQKIEKFLGYAVIVEDYSFDDLQEKLNPVGMPEKVHKRIWEFIKERAQSYRRRHVQSLRFEEMDGLLLPVFTDLQFLFHLHRRGFSFSAIQAVQEIVQKWESFLWSFKNLWLLQQVRTSTDTSSDRGEFQKHWERFYEHLVRIHRTLAGNPAMLWNLQEKDFKDALRAGITVMHRLYRQFG